METEITKDSDIKAVVTALSGGDNIAAQASFNQVMQMKKDAALEIKKGELAAAVFVNPEEPVQEPKDEDE